LNQKDFIYIRPMKGSLGPKEQISIDITILIGNRTIPLVASGPPLDEILVIEIRNGRHIFLSLQGTFQRTCFGMPIEVLASLGGKGVRNVDSSARKLSGGGLPDEIWRMTDFIMSYGQGCGSVFLERGDEGLCRGIRECLDTAKEFDLTLISEGEIGVMSMAETLLRFLDALPESIIPEGVFPRAMRMAESKGSMMEVWFSPTSQVLRLVDGQCPGPTCECADLSNVVHSTDLGMACFHTKSRSEETNWYDFCLWKKLIAVRAFAKVLIRSPLKSRSEDLPKKETLLSRLLAE